MEKKLVRIPFDLVMAKKITNGEVEGRIVTRSGQNVRILCFDRKDEYRPIIALVMDDNIETVYAMYKSGLNSSSKQERNDLMLEVPEYPVFKEGDILYSVYGPFIYNGIYNAEKHGYGAYCGINSMGILQITGDGYLEDGNSKWTTKDVRYATEDESQKLSEELEKCKLPIAKEYLRRFFDIEVITGFITQCEFTTGQPVLGKDDNGQWRYDMFSHYQPQLKGKYICIGRSYSECLPYNYQTMHLIGTTV